MDTQKKIDLILEKSNAKLQNGLFRKAFMALLRESVNKTMECGASLVMSCSYDKNIALLDQVIEADGDKDLETTFEFKVALPSLHDVHLKYTELKNSLTLDELSLMCLDLEYKEENKKEE